LNKFEIKFKYLIYLHGNNLAKCLYFVFHFILFPQTASASNAGTFQLYGDALTKFSIKCQNVVTQTSTIPKKEVQVNINDKYSFFLVLKYYNVWLK
jgi:hypothetical protein